MENYSRLSIVLGKGIADIEKKKKNTLYPPYT